MANDICSGLRLNPLVNVPPNYECGICRDNFRATDHVISHIAPTLGNPTPFAVHFACLQQAVNFNHKCSLCNRHLTVLPSLREFKDPLAMAIINKDVGRVRELVADGRQKDDQLIKFAEKAITEKQFEIAIVLMRACKKIDPIIYKRILTNAIAQGDVKFVKNVLLTKHRQTLGALDKLELVGSVNVRNYPLRSVVIQYIQLEENNRNDIISIVNKHRDNCFDLIQFMGHSRPSKFPPLPMEELRDWAGRREMFPAPQQPGEPDFFYTWRINGYWKHVEQREIEERTQIAHHQFIYWIGEGNRLQVERIANRGLDPATYELGKAIVKEAAIHLAVAAAHYAGVYDPERIRNTVFIAAAAVNDCKILEKDLHKVPQSTLNQAFLVAAGRGWADAAALLQPKVQEEERNLGIKAARINGYSSVARYLETAYHQLAHPLIGIL